MMQIQCADGITRKERKKPRIREDTRREEMKKNFEFTWKRSGKLKDQS